MTSDSRYNVTWMCSECGEKWADPEQSDTPCTATAGCSGEPFGVAYWAGEADGSETRYNSDGTRAS
jgi:hypothetical protein